MFVSAFQFLQSLEKSLIDGDQFRMFQNLTAERDGCFRCN